MPRVEPKVPRPARESAAPLVLRPLVPRLDLQVHPLPLDGFNQYVEIRTCGSQAGRGGAWPRVPRMDRRHPAAEAMSPASSLRRARSLETAGRRLFFEQVQMKASFTRKHRGALDQGPPSIVLLIVTARCAFRSPRRVVRYYVPQDAASWCRWSARPPSGVPSRKAIHEGDVATSGCARSGPLAGCR